MKGKMQMCMHAGGGIFGKMLTNSKEAYCYWHSKGYRNYEFDVCRTDDGKYVTSHDFSHEAFKRLGIDVIPDYCTHDWFINNELYTNEDLALHAFSLDDILGKLLNKEIDILMIDPKDFTFEGTCLLLSYIHKFLSSTQTPVKERLIIETYNLDMLKATVLYPDLATYQYCVDDDIQQGNSSDMRKLPPEELFTLLSKYNIKTISYPWKQAVENLYLLKDFISCDFTVFSRTRNDILSSLLQHSGVSYNIVDFIVDDEQKKELHKYKEDYFRKYEKQIYNVFNTQKKVLTVGVFDLLHIGHVNLFRRAKDLGDVLIVAVQESDVVLKYKPNAKLVYSTEERMYMVKSVRFVDNVITYQAVDEIIKTVDFDILAIGEDQNHDGFQKAMQWCNDNDKEFVILPRTENISSSWIKEQIKMM